jgi:uncharacterized protein (TIGR00297 family)
MDQELIWNALLGAGIAWAVCAPCFRLGALSKSGASVSAGVILLLSMLGGLAATACLVFAFAVIAAADMAVGRVSPKQEHAARSARQVLENGLPALLAAAGYYATRSPAFLAGTAAALGEALCDSLASDVGALSKREPVDLCRLRPVPRGRSGGVSVLGTLSGLAGAAVCGGFCVPVLGLSWAWLPGLVLLPMAGMLFDSVLGSLVQARFRCAVCGKETEKPVHCGKPARHVSGLRLLDNGGVNLLTNFLTAAAAVLCFL